MGKSKSPQLNVMDTNHPFLLGNLLGDGYITKRGGLTIDQEALTYSKWKFDILCQCKLQGVDVLPATTKIAKVTRIHSKTKKISVALLQKVVF